MPSDCLLAHRQPDAQRSLQLRRRNLSQRLMLSQTVASVAAFAYLAVVANRLATNGRHPGAMLGGLLIVGTPYVVGSLVLLSSHEA